MAPSKKSLLGFVTAGLLLVGLLILLLRSRAGMSTSTETKEAISGTIRKALMQAGYSARAADYWVAIAKFESANFNSQLCTKYHNLFGMSYPTVGKNYGKVTLNDAGTPHNFSTYDTFKESVEDLLEYLAAFKYSKDPESIDELVNYMKSKNYFGSPVSTYLAGVKRYL